MLNYVDRRIRRVTVSGLVTLFTLTVLVVYLLPFGYMATTSIKTQNQISRNNTLPLTQHTYAYEGEALPHYRVETGKEYPTYLVPINGRPTPLAFIAPATEDSPNIFLNPSSLAIVEWEGDISSLASAPQIALYTATPATANAEYGVENSKRYPIYEVETADGIQQWALIRSPEHIFIDINQPNEGVIKWTGDLSTLAPAQQISFYKYRGNTDPATGLVKNKNYPLYQLTLEDGTVQEWAQVKGKDHVFINVGNPDAGVFEWEGDLLSLQQTEDTYTHFGALNREQGLASNEAYPIYTSPEGEQWALVREGTGAEESLFINASASDALVNRVFDDSFSPVLETGVFLYQGKYDEREYGLVSLGNYPVYLVPGEEGDQKWALLRAGTGTDESVFLNISKLGITITADQIEFIQEAVDVSTLTPVYEQTSKYRHNSSIIPPWSVQPGDKLLLYSAPVGGRGDEWALVAAGTPGKSPTYYISPSDPDAGIFEYSDKWVGSLETLDYFDPAWENYKNAWDLIDFPRLLFNTLAIAVIGIVGTLLSCTIVAYGFARFPIPYKNAIFLVLIGTIILPRQVTLVPTYTFFAKIGWTNTWLPLTIPHFFANAYNVFLLRQFFQTIPREMDEAAMIDGAGPIRVLRSIIVPQAYPALVAAGLFHLVFAWNDYFEPLIYLLGRPELQPISVGVQRFNFIYNRQPNFIQATSLMAMILPIFLFLISQRFFMRGIVITGVDK